MIKQNLKFKILIDHSIKSLTRLQIGLLRANISKEGPPGLWPDSFFLLTSVYFYGNFLFQQAANIKKTISMPTEQ